MYVVFRNCCKYYRGLIVNYIKASSSTNCEFSTTNSSLLRALYFVPADGPYLHSYFNYNGHLNTTSTATIAPLWCKNWPLQNGHLIADWLTVFTLFMFCKRSRILFSATRLWSLLLLGFYLIDIFWMCLVFSTELQSQKSGVVFHPYLPITATSIQRPHSSYSF